MADSSLSSKSSFVSQSGSFMFWELRDDGFGKKSEKLNKFVQETGLFLAFQTIFAEIIGRDIPDRKHFSYTAKRLREFGKEIERIVTLFFILASFLFFCSFFLIILDPNYLDPPLSYAF